MPGWVAMALTTRSLTPVAQYDIVIYGGTSAGIAAALQASRLGRSVVLLEPGQRIETP